MISLIVACPFISVLLQVRGDLHGVHDPSRAVFSSVDEKWHVFSSHDGMRTAYTQTANLQSGWIRGGPLLGDIPPWAKAKVPKVGAQDFWAPDLIHAHNVNEWRLFYAVSSFGSQTSCIGLASSPDPVGTWTDRGQVFCSQSGDPFNAIDPAPLIDSSHRHWLTFGSFWNGIYIIELERETGLVKTGAMPVGPLARDPKSRSNSIEASYMHEEGGLYYLFVNWGACCKGTNSTYRIFVGRSESPTGPFVDAAGKDMAQGGGLIFIDTHWHDAPNQVGSGHIGVMHSGGNAYITYHYYDAGDAGRPALGIRPLWFDSNKWPVAGPPISTNEILA